MAYGGGSVAGSVAAYVILARVKPGPLTVAAVVGLSAPMWLLPPFFGILAAALATVSALNLVQAIIASPPAVAQEAA